MTHDLTKGSPFHNILMMSLPIMLGNLFQQLYSIVDTIIVGRLVGSGALAAVGSTTSMSFLIMWFVGGMAGGYAIVLAANFGAGDIPALRRGICLSLELSAIVSVLVTTISLFGLRSFLHLMRMPEDIFEDAYTYIFVIIAGTAATVFYNIGASILRAMGDSKTPLYFLILSSLLNIGLDIVLIRYFEMGVFGAAIATVASQVVSGILCFAYMYLHFEEVRFGGTDWKPDWTRSLEMLSFGIPAGLYGATTAIGILIIQFAINCYGTVIIAGYTAAIKVQNFVEIPLNSFSMTMVNFEGQNLGAGNRENMKKGYRDCMMMGLETAALSCVFLLVLGRGFSALFVTGMDAEMVVDFAAKYLRYTAPFFFPYAVLLITRSTLQGMGDKAAPVINGVLESALRIAFTVYLVGHLSETLLCLVNPVIWTVAAVGLLVMYHRFWGRCFCEEDGPF